MLTRKLLLVAVRAVATFTILRLFYLSIGSLVLTSLTIVFVAVQQCFLRGSRETLGKPCSLLQHYTQLSATETKELIDDVRHTNEGTLANLWETFAKEKTLVVLLTGATGYVGNPILHELLSLSTSSTTTMQEGTNKKIFVTVRAKTRGLGKTIETAADRLLSIRSNPIFKDLLPIWDATVELVETGDLGTPNCGICPETLAMLKGAGIGHLIHCAADVRFNTPLYQIATQNVSASLQMQSFARQWNCCGFVYVSTAFSHPGCGSAACPLPEEVVPIGDFDAREIYQSMLGDQWLAEKAKHELGFKNNYVFSKFIAEHLLSQDDSALALSIIRPAIVGPAWMLPYPGWNGSAPSTISAFAMLSRTRILRVFIKSSDPLPVIPVDVVAVAVVQAVLSPEKAKASSKAHEIRNLVWDLVLPVEPLHSLWVTTGRIGATDAVWQMYMLRLVRLWPSVANPLHLLVDVGPIYFLMAYEKVLSLVFTRRREAKPRKISSSSILFFMKMIDAYDWYQNNRFHFTCTYRQPRFLTQNQYIMRSLLQSVEHKIPPRLWNVPTELESSTGYCLRYVNLIPTDRCDFWWVITQPYGNMIIRLIAYLVSKVLRRAFREVIVDVQSLAAFSRELAKDEWVPVCLAPTHRSVFDFVLLQYCCFSLPGLGLKIPYIAASIDFKSLGFAPVLRWAHAFWVERGAKDQLTTTLLGLLGNKKWLTVFVEGKRSRDRRFCAPKRGFLRALQTAARDAGAPILLPVVIDYEKIPEHNAFELELSSSSQDKHALSSQSVLRWLYQMLSWETTPFGDVRIGFAEPLRLYSGDDIALVASTVQARQRACSTVTSFHLEAAEKDLGLPTELLLSAIVAAGGSVSRRSSLFASTSTIVSPIESWCLHMQWAHLFAPLLFGTHRKWATWIIEEAQIKQSVLLDGGCNTPELEHVASRLKALFDDADKAALEAKAALHVRGICRPSAAHICRECSKGKVENTTFLIPLSMAAATFLVGDDVCGENYSDQLARVGPVEPAYNYGTVSGEDEAFGRWGFSDSGFILSYKANSRNQMPTVKFKGSRYHIAGQEFRSLLPFFESSLGVKIDFQRNYSARTRQQAPKPTAAADTTGVIEALTSLGFKDGQLSTDVRSRARRGTGHALQDIYGLKKGLITRLPDIVCWPESEDDCIKLARTAQKSQWCLIPFGGGTNVTHATRCPPWSVDSRCMISVDMKRMNHVVWISRDDGLAHIEAGIVGRELVERLAAQGLTLGHEPDSIEFSTLGGWVATKASGMKRNRYGNIEDIVKEVRLVTSSGILLQHHLNNNPDKRTLAYGRTSVGTELKDLAMGSEGNLGIITSVVLRVHPLPEKIEYGSAVFPNFEVGVGFVRDVARLQAALRPASVRLIENLQLQLSRHFASATASLMESAAKIASKQYLTGWLGWKPSAICGCTVLFEGSGVEISIQKRLLRGLVTKHGGREAGGATGAAGYHLTYAIAYLRGFLISYDIFGESFETFVPWSRCLALCVGVKNDVEAAHGSRSLPGTPIVSCRVTQLYSEGACVYFYVATSVAGVTGPLKVFEELEKIARQSCLHHGGSLSHHHGVGKIRAPFMPAVNSPTLIKCLKDFKKCIDDSNVFGVSNGIYGCDDRGEEYQLATPTTWTALEEQNDSGTSSSGTFVVDDLPILRTFIDTTDFIRTNHHLLNLSSAAKLELYGLYKQAKGGNCSIKARPGFYDVTGRAKFDAWKSLEGLSTEQAMKEYSAVVERHRAA